MTATFIFFSFTGGLVFYCAMICKFFMMTIWQLPSHPFFPFCVWCLAGHGAPNTPMGFPKARICLLRSTSKFRQRTWFGQESTYCGNSNWTSGGCFQFLKGSGMNDVHIGGIQLISLLSFCLRIVVVVVVIGKGKDCVRVQVVRVVRFPRLRVFITTPLVFSVMKRN